MTSYENAPATKLLATQCCICNRPLLDAVSVEMGIGPDCRKKYMGKTEGASPEARAEANKIVHELALIMSGVDKAAIAADSVDPEALESVYHLGGPKAVGQMIAAKSAKGTTLLDRLMELGFGKLVEKLEKAWITLKVTRELVNDQWTGNLIVTAPYSEEANGSWRGIRGRRWDKALKANVVPVGSLTLTGPDTNSDKLWELFKAHYPGCAGIGPKGPFVVPVPATKSNLIPVVTADDDYEREASIRAHAKAMDAALASSIEAMQEMESTYNEDGYL